MPRKESERDILVRLLAGEANFTAMQPGSYEIELSLESARLAEDKLNKFATMTQEGVTPLFYFNGQKAPIRNIRANENVIYLTVELDPDLLR